jgi:hypothetical protein
VVIVRWLIETWEARQVLRAEVGTDPLANLIVWTINIILLIIIAAICTGR